MANTGNLRATTGRCHSCGEELYENDEVVLGQVVTVLHSGRDLLHVLVVDDEGEPVYDALLLHEGCWEELLWHLNERHRDIPPSFESHNIVKCDACGSDVLAGERVGIGDVARLGISPRTGAPLFPEEIRNRLYMCLPCINQLTEDSDEQLIGSDLWQEATQNGECAGCTEDRCWREGMPCECPCHEDDEADEEESEWDSLTAEEEEELLQRGQHYR
jgi:hypothetical protein